MTATGLEFNDKWMINGAIDSFITAPYFGADSFQLRLAMSRHQCYSASSPSTVPLPYINKVVLMYSSLSHVLYPTFVSN